MKKDFKDTRFGKIIDKVKNVGLDVAPIIAKVGTGNISGAISDTISLLNGSDNSQAKELLDELTIRKKEIELDYYRVMTADIADARNREVEMAKTGKTDWLMYAAGITALSTFVLMVIAVIFVIEVRDNPLFHQLMGIIEGVALTVFSYYFGSSKGSKDKSEMLSKR